MNLVVNKINKAIGKITIPGDKSISHRSIMLGGIAKGETYVHNLLLSEDVKSTITCLEKLGVIIKQQKHITIVKGTIPKYFKPCEKQLNAGNSGTTVRLMLGLISGSNNSYIFTGDSSLRKRPMKRITDPLCEMGANINFLENKNLLPIKINGGNLKGVNYKLPVASAQVKSAIILAALQSEGNATIEEPEITRDHTEIMVNYLGGKVKRQNSFIKIEGGQTLFGNEIYIPGDISSAAFLIILALILPKSELLIQNVGLNPTRSGIINVLISMNANIEIVSEKILNGEKSGDILIKNSNLKGITIEGSIIPNIIDEIPILAVAATQAEGTTIIRNAEELKVKESNRIEMIVSQLKKMGANIVETEDGMIIEGPTKLKGAEVNSGGDHRIAMALAIAGMISEGETKILESNCISISFPEFENTLKQITI